jgi:hypothetical protein
LLRIRTHGRTRFWLRNKRYVTTRHKFLLFEAVAVITPLDRVGDGYRSRDGGKS